LQVSLGVAGILLHSPPEFGQVLRQSHTRFLQDGSFVTNPYLGVQQVLALFGFHDVPLQNSSDQNLSLYLAGFNIEIG
jgi:hypothetical protein